MKRDCIGLGIHQTFNQSTDFVHQHPPGLFPGTHSPVSPNLGIVVERLLSRARQCTKGIADQITGLRQDGKLTAKAKESVRHESILAPIPMAHDFHAYLVSTSL